MGSWLETESNDIGMDGSRELQRSSSERQTQAEIRGVAVSDGSDKVWIRLHFMFVVWFDFSNCTNLIYLLFVVVVFGLK